MRSIARVFTALAICAIAMIGVATAEDPATDPTMTVGAVVAPTPTPPTELSASAEWMSLDSGQDTIDVHLDLTFPLGSHFAVGPTFTYAKIKPNPLKVDPVPTPEPPPPVTPEGGDIETDPPAAFTSTSPGGNSLETWAMGIRTAFYFTKTHNGFYAAVEGVIPQEDAEGYVITPEVGVQFVVGHFLMRTAYRVPQHYSEGDLVDLGSKSVTAGFGAAW